MHPVLFLCHNNNEKKGYTGTREKEVGKKKNNHKCLKGVVEEEGGVLQLIGMLEGGERGGKGRSGQGAKTKLGNVLEPGGGGRGKTGEYPIGTRSHSHKSQ